MNQPIPRDDAQEAILDLYFARSEQALQETERLYGARLRGLCRRILDSAEDAEECVSDTLLAAWQSIPPARPTHLAAWLLKVARRLAIGRLKHDRALKRGGGLVEALEELSELELAAGEDIPGESGVITAALSDWLRRQPASRRVAFVRRYWYADPLEEIARRTGQSEAAVKSLLFRMRRELEQHLKQEGISL